MNIYFACSITGGRQDQKKYQAITTYLLDKGHQIPTARLAKSNVIQLERKLSPYNVFDRDTRWIRGCDVLLAEISTPSHGVGFEICYALQLSKPVICVFRDDVSVSRMILGNPDNNLRISGYKDINEALFFIETILKELAHS